jgi:hypothetical protein
MPTATLAVGTEPPFRVDLSPEAEEQSLLETVTRQLLVKTLRAKKDSVIFLKCRNSGSVIVI